MFLYWLGSGCAYRLVGRSFDIPRSTVGDIIREMLPKVLALLSDIAYFQRAQDNELIASKYREKSKTK